MSKSITHFSVKAICFICRHASQRKMILLSRYYITRGGTTMYYAKKVVIFITMHIFFHKEYLIRSEAPQDQKALDIRTPRWNLRSNITHISLYELDHTIS